MKLAPDNIDAILTAPEAQVRMRTGDRVRIVVCGGTALAVLQLIPRTTKDVDVLAWAREAEMAGAAAWVVTQDVSEPFRMVLKDFLGGIGHAAVAEGL